MPENEEYLKVDKSINKFTIDLDPNKKLPEIWRIPSAAHHLYRFGISFYPNGCTKRPLIYHPIIVLLMPFILWIKFTYSVLDPGLSTKYWDYLIVGDFGYFMNCRFHLNLTASVAYGMAIMIHLLHIINYFLKREPTYMLVFHMMSGNISPKSIGLTNPLNIKDIIKKTRLALKVAYFLSNFMGAEAFCLTFCAFIFSVPFTQFIYIGLPHTIAFTVSSLYIFRNISYHIIYFYIISYYITSKLREINTELRNAIKTKIILNLYQTSKTFNEIYLEINEYDSQFWSKFLFIVWMSSSGVIALLIFILLGGEDRMDSHIIMINAIFFFAILSSILIETGGSLSLEVKKTYKLLASYKFVSLRKPLFLIPKARYALKVIVI